PQVGLTLLAAPELASVRLVLKAYADPAAAGVTVKQHIRDVNWHLARQAPPLRALGVSPPHVLVHAVDSFHDDLATFVDDLQHFFGRTAGVIAGEDLHQVSALDFHGYTTSLARLIIFMNRRSRNSRATAPKMRVPLGFNSLSIRTMALRSNRT